MKRYDKNQIHLKSEHKTGIWEGTKIARTSYKYCVKFYTICIFWWIFDFIFSNFQRIMDNIKITASMHIIAATANKTKSTIHKENGWVMKKYKSQQHSMIGKFVEFTQSLNISHIIYAIIFIHAHIMLWCRNMFLCGNLSFVSINNNVGAVAAAAVDLNFHNLSLCVRGKRIVQFDVLLQLFQCFASFRKHAYRMRWSIWKYDFDTMCMCARCWSDIFWYFDIFWNHLFSLMILHQIWMAFVRMGQSVKSNFWFFTFHFNFPNIARLLRSETFFVCCWGVFLFFGEVQLLSCQSHLC